MHLESFGAEALGQRSDHAEEPGISRGNHADHAVVRPDRIEHRQQVAFDHDDGTGRSQYVQVASTAHHEFGGLQRMPRLLADRLAAAEADDGNPGAGHPLHGILRRGALTLTHGQPAVRLRSRP